MTTMPVPSSMSFAKIAAQGGKENVALKSLAKATAVKIPVAGSSRRDSSSESTIPIFSGVENSSVVESEALDNLEKNTITRSYIPNAPTASNDTSTNMKLLEAVKAINIQDSTPSLVVNGSQKMEPHNRGVFGETSPDDPFQRVDSGSELDTKPPSLDGKSITSGTTFALDEKESLRPDDSASVKAAEDDDTFSGRGSIVAGSRIGSEAAARAYRAQTYDIQDRRTLMSTLDPQSHGAVTPLSGSSGQQVVDGVDSKNLIDPVGLPEGFSLFYKQTPDDKLLEALDSPKDRIFLLRLEQNVIEFVKDSKEPYIDLPPSNSFCRMLTHKLADYYHMTHQFDQNTASVRIFRTPFCRLPASLTSISNPPTSGNTPPPTMPTMKIMRRGGETGESPSKATSETGSDGKDKSASGRDKLSREEREAAYIKARERIFGNSDKTGDVTPDTEEGNDMSRSSSVSAKDRGGQNKRGKTGKQRRDDSESFDVRSQYTPFFPPPQQPTWAPSVPQYPPMNVPQFGGPMQNPYPSISSSPYIPQSQQFHPGMVSPLPPYNQIHQQFPRLSPPQYQTPGSSAATYSSPIQNMPQQTQPWGPSVYQTPYQTRGPVSGGPPVPYLYGQLPSAINPSDPKSQHPIPGSFNRRAFNPKTQVFVPSNGNPSMPQSMQQPMPHQQPMLHQQSMSYQQPIVHHGAVQQNYNSFNPPQQYNNGLGYNMSRQSSNTSLPSYHASPHIPPRPMMHQGINSSANGNLPHYGNLSSLPPKPPPTA